MQALQVYDALARRVVIDLQLQPMVFDVLGVQITRDEGVALLDALSSIHHARNPVRPRTEP